MLPSLLSASVLLSCAAVVSSSSPIHIKFPASALSSLKRSGHARRHQGLLDAASEPWTSVSCCAAAAACDWAALLICPRLRRFLALAVGVCALTPVDFAVSRLPAKVCKALRDAARPILSWWTGGRAARAFVATVFPQAARDLAFALRITPVLARYHRARGRIAAKRRTGEYIFNTTERMAQWAELHEWASVVVRDIIRDLGGFYRKVGQIAGTASQMMPPAWVRAFAETMDDNPPIPAKVIKKLVAREMRRNKLGDIDDVFESFAFERPVATASIAQVHRAQLRPGMAPFTDVAVKVVIPNNRKRIMGDLHSMARVCRFMQLIGLDGGIDMPTIINAYLDIVPDEFDLRKEANKICSFRFALLKEGSSKGRSLVPYKDHAESTDELCARAVASASRKELQGKIALPDVVDNLACEKMLVMRWFDGISFLDMLRNEREDGSQQPRLPQEVARRFGNWEGVFKTLHVAWGMQVLALGEFHTDPHPGNMIFLRDGRLGILDWGQTKVLGPKNRRLVSQCVLAMVDEDPQGITKAIEDSGEFVFKSPSPALWALIAYTFFDTRWTPIAGVNIYDLDNSILNANGFVRNSREAFPLIRVIFLMRGLMDSCATEASMINRWDPFARAVLGQDAKPPSPKRRFRRLAAGVTKTALRRLPSKWICVAAGSANSASSAKLATMMQSVLDAQRSGNATKQQRSFMDSLLQ